MIIEELNGTAMYIHIPFCHHICTYCDFSKVYYDSSWVNMYLDALEKEIESINIDRMISTLYIGGGTPTSLTEDELDRLLKIIEPYSKNVVEYTIEINPETMTYQKLLILKHYGITRLSIGVQTFNEAILKKIGRKHQNSQVFSLIEDAKKLGFDNISIDLMYNLPNQKIVDIKNDLCIVEQLDIQHISYYSLILEKHTILYNKDFKGMDDDEEYECMKLIYHFLNKIGYQHYEISNYAKIGYESIHNQAYWHNMDYYGVGLGAHGNLDNQRYCNTRSLNNYYKGNYRIHEEEINCHEKIFEGIMLGLRMTKGINIELFNQRYQCDLIDRYSLVINKNIELGLLCIENGYLHATGKGINLLHLILMEFMD